MDSNLNFQITRLQKEISKAEISPNQNLLNSKREKLRELEKRLNEKNTQPRNNFKI
jgi:hypothetical protein